MNSIRHCVCLICFPVISMCHWEYLNFRHSFISNSSCHVVYVACVSCGPWSITVMVDDWHSHSFKPSPVYCPGPRSCGLVQWHSSVRISGLGDHGFIFSLKRVWKVSSFILIQDANYSEFFNVVSPICKGKSWMEIMVFWQSSCTSCPTTWHCIAWQWQHYELKYTLHLPNPEFHVSSQFNESHKKIYDKHWSSHMLFSQFTFEFCFFFSFFVMFI